MTRNRSLRAAPLLAALLLLSGCPWKKENEELKKQNAQLNQDKQRLEGEATAAGAANTEMQGTLDDVEKNLEELRIKELKVIRTSLEVTKEGKATPSKKQQLLTDIAEIKKAVHENLEKLALLEKQKKAAMKKADALGKKVTTLERLIDEMKHQLEEKETTIVALEEKVLSLSQTVTTQAGQIQQQQGVIETQTTDLNTAYFVIGTKK
ncbi:MAG TPA: hypothetical protein VGR00_05940, partial [Thermoanaerobaculia bacterium]|nr:hypothetical protein [Thermoanaerobaculia bacterium]